jgi:hypothetical protein
MGRTLRRTTSPVEGQKSRMVRARGQRRLAGVTA